MDTFKGNNRLNVINASQTSVFSNIRLIDENCVQLSCKRLNICLRKMEDLLEFTFQ